MQDPHDEHPLCFKDEDTQELLVVHTAHGMASEPVDRHVESSPKNGVERAGHPMRWE